MAESIAPISDEALNALRYLLSRKARHDDVDQLLLSLLARLSAAEARATQAELLAETRYEDGLDEGDRRTRAEMEARAARAEVKGFNEGIEAAAQMFERDYVADSLLTIPHVAEAIRALTRSAPATGQDTTTGESDV